MNSEIKILSLVAYPFLPPRMGGQKGIALFNEHLAQRLPLYCVCTENNDPQFAKGYTLSKVLSNKRSRYINPAYFFKLKKIIREQQITHLILEHPYYGWLGLLLKWFCGVKLIVHSHNIESLRFKSMGQWWWGLLWHYEKNVHSRAAVNFFIHEEDRAFAIRRYKLKAERCHTITYGFDLQKAPADEERRAAHQAIAGTWDIAPGEKILLFNGTLDYKPNRDALDCILQTINPILLQQPGFTYKIIICGNKLPAAYQDLIAYREKNIIYAGFVDDISLYFKGADIFINPVKDGGGIKTKVVEALGSNLSVVSTQSGAIGIPLNLTGNKLVVVKDNAQEDFARAILQTETASCIPDAFFTHFYWGNIAAKAADAIIAG